MGVVNRISNKRAPSKGQNSKLFLSIGHPDRVRPVHEILGGFAYVVTCAATVTTGAYTVTNLGAAISYTAGGSDTPATIIKALHDKINAANLPVTASALDLTARTFRISRSSAFPAVPGAPGVTSPDTELTIGSLLTFGAVAKGAASITLPVATKSRISVGEHLLFVDSDENYTMVKVAAVAAAGATELTIEAAPRAIAEGSVCEFPGYFWDLSTVGIDRSYNREETQTFNTGVDSDGTITGSTKGSSLEVLYTAINGALYSAWFAADAGVEVYFERELAAPNGFSRGHVTFGHASVTAMPDAAPIGNVTMSPALTFNGAISEILPDPLPA